MENSMEFGLLRFWQLPPELLEAHLLFLAPREKPQSVSFCFSDLSFLILLFAQPHLAADNLDKIHDERGNNLLHIAASQGHTECLQHLTSLMGEDCLNERNAEKLTPAGLAIKVRGWDRAPQPGVRFQFFKISTELKCWGREREESSILSKQQMSIIFKRLIISVINCFEISSVHSSLLCSEGRIQIS